MRNHRNNHKRNRFRNSGDRNFKRNGVHQKISSDFTTNGSDFRRKNPGKKGVKPKTKGRPVNPSQKSREIQDPNKSVEDFIEDIKINDQIKILTWKYYTREMATEVTENLTAK